MIKKLAKITCAELQIKYTGVLSFIITVDYEEGTSQGIGGFPLDGVDIQKNKRVGTAFGCEIIRRLLETLNVNDFSEMKGQIIWVHGEGEGLKFKPKGIESLKVNGLNLKPLIFDDVYKDFC